MRVFLTVIILLLWSNLTAIGQTAPGKYWVRFTDKANSPFSISAPEEFLSARSIQRRVNQGITVEENDLPINPAYLDSLTSFGLTIYNKSKWFNAVTVQTTDTALIDSISNLSFVAGIQKVLRWKGTLPLPEPCQMTPYSQKGGASVLNVLDYGLATSQIELMNGQVLHNAGYQGEGMQIAIIDGGFIAANQIIALDSLYQNNQILAARDFVLSTNDVYLGHLHGMNVLSTMGAYKPGEMIGTAPKASFYLLRSEDTGSEYLLEEDNWVSAAEFADSAGADIINTSLGYNTFDDPAQNHTYADLDGNTTHITIGTDIAASKGILPVTSAGNAGNQDWHYITAPGDADSALTVGAVNLNGTYASLSSTGPTADGRIKPNIAAPGKDVIIANASDSVSFGSGTSFASPIIAGLAACLWQAFPELSNMELLEEIEKSSSQYSNPDSLLGYGIPDFSLALTTISAKKLKKERIIRVFPNPFGESFSIDFYSKDSQDVKIEIFNILGTLVLTRNETCTSNSFNSYPIRTDCFNSGIYILRLSSSNSSYKSFILKAN